MSAVIRCGGLPPAGDAIGFGGSDGLAARKWGGVFTACARTARRL